MLAGPAEIVGELIKGITVKADCTGQDALPNISFTIDNTTYTLAPADYVLKVTEGGQTECLLGIQAINAPAGFNYIILGDVFMRKYATYFNLNDNTVSFMYQNKKTQDPNFIF